MKRTALLIANPGEAGGGFCPGVQRDLDNYQSFLLSPIGGMWSADEIQVLMKPSTADVRAAVGRVSAADYGLVLFTGHGYYSGEKESTILQLRSGQEIDAIELRRGAEKRTLILDCCRVVQRPLALTEKMLKAARMRVTVHPDDCRRYYDARIEKCAPGLLVAFACSKGQTAGDTPDGGVYSYGLLKRAQEWAEHLMIDTSKDVRVLSVVEAHDKAIEAVSELSGGTQTPEIQKPRSEPHFPMCIVT